MRYPAFILVFFLCSAFSLPNNPPDIQRIIADDLPYLIDFYKTRHKNPEISLEEKETSATLAKELEKIGFTVTQNFGGYGIVGIFKNGNGPTILYRTDMDALPMPEKTGLKYASTKTIQYKGAETGAMHSCGHDMHMTSWLGTARAMVKMKKEWKGTLMFIGQPAEEIGAGSKLMLDAGLYKKFGVPDYGIGLHCSPTIPAGQVGLAKGFTMANTESIDIKVFGRGAHGASPHKSIDPVVLSSLMVMEFQTIVSRNVDPIESAVLTVGSITGGTKHNIIPDEVKMQITLRTFKEDVRQLIHKRIREIAKGVAISAGLPEDMYPEVIIPGFSTVPNYNNPELVDQLSASAAKIIGSENVVYAAPQMVAEDFSRYGQTEHKIPTVLYWLGTIPPDRQEAAARGESIPALHSPYFYPDPKPSIETGVTVTTQMMLDLFNTVN
ncbi:MAG: amidohydrolase [Saprospiraceae bacterium]|nr:amidohydrolase [Saprospiraceae bacterium]